MTTFHQDVNFSKTFIWKGFYLDRPSFIWTNFVVAHNRKTPFSAIFGPKFSKLKLMHYHIRWATGLKFCMDITMVLCNAHAEIFFLGQPILEQWHFNFDWSTPKWPKTKVFDHQKKRFGQQIFFRSWSVDLFIWSL